MTHSTRVCGLFPTLTGGPSRLALICDLCSPAWPQEDQPLGMGRVVATTAGRTSSLLVARAGLTDSGEYTCQPTDAEADHVMVHVLTGQSGNARGSQVSRETRVAHRSVLGFVRVTGQSGGM